MRSRRRSRCPAKEGPAGGGCHQPSLAVTLRVLPQIAELRFPCDVRWLSFWSVGRKPKGPRRRPVSVAEGNCVEPFVCTKDHPTLFDVNQATEPRRITAIAQQERITD